MVLCHGYAIAKISLSAVRSRPVRTLATNEPRRTCARAWAFTDLDTVHDFYRITSLGHRSRARVPYLFSIRFLRGFWSLSNRSPCHKTHKTDIHMYLSVQGRGYRSACFQWIGPFLGRWTEFSEPDSIDVHIISIPLTFATRRTYAKQTILLAQFCYRLRLHEGLKTYNFLNFIRCL